MEDNSKEYFKDIEYAIEEYKKKGVSPENISIAFGGLYKDNVINYTMLKYALNYLGFEVTKELDNMTDIERIEHFKKQFKNNSAK